MSETTEEAENFLQAGLTNSDRDSKINLSADGGPGSGRKPEGGGSQSGAGKKAGKTKYAPSPRTYFEGITVAHATYTKLCGQLYTNHTDIKPGDRATLSLGKYFYSVTAKEDGKLIINKRYERNHAPKRRKK